MATGELGALSVSRREFLATSVAAVGAATMPFGGAAAQGSAKYHRLNVNDPQAAGVLDSYKIAIEKMLDLPADDPRNWYRNALVHTLDCPHGNWWFLPWHRGYLGYFEQMCRDLSGNPDFAFPYWDWTADPRVPDAMFDGVLTPNDDAYIPTFANFRTDFEGYVTSFWNGLSGPQFNALLSRGYRFPEDLWWDVENYPMFFEPPNARGLTQQQPDFDADTIRTVSLPTILNALSPRDFLTFGSPKTAQHSGLTGFGVLEGFPHNNVHMCVGGFFLSPRRTGFMQDNLSPVDPLFFLHHANIDRLWDVWTRKQQGLGLPTLPEGNDLGRWSNERLLFFFDAMKQPATKILAGDYATIGDFDYDYTPGSGEEVVPAAAVAVAAAPGPVQSFSAQMSTSSAAGTASADVIVPAPLLASDQDAQAQLVAKITVAFPPLSHSQALRVLVNPTGSAAALDSSSPHSAGRLTMFGRHVMSGPVTFTVPLAMPLASLRASNLLAAEAPLNIQVVPEMGPMVSAAGVEESTPEVLSIVVEAH